jgi:prophage regulatory protein
MLTKKKLQTTAKPKPKPKQDPAAAPFSPQGIPRRAKPELELPGPRIIRRKEVLRMLGIGRTAFDELIRRGEFPKPIKITGKRALGWFLDDVLDYMARLRAARDAA